MKRVLSFVLALVMVMGLLPITTFADVVTPLLLVTNIEITGIERAVVGEAPDRTAVIPAGKGCELAAPEGYEDIYINGIAWYDNTANAYMAQGDVFLSGHLYTPMFAVRPKAGYIFASISAMHITSELSEETELSAFPGIAEGQHLMVKPVDYTVRPLETSTITTRNCAAYDAGGNLITEAMEGNWITVRAQSSILGQTFLGWIVEPETVSITQEGYGTAYFCMPEYPVSVTAVYEEVALDTVRIFLDQPTVGREADFTAANSSGDYFYPGYGFVTPEYLKNEYFDGVAWYDETAGHYLTPGDTFTAGHMYTVSVMVAASEGYCFGNNLTGYISHGGNCTTDALHDSSTPENKYRLVTSSMVSPVAPLAIAIQGGTAYDAAGNEICEAFAGDVVTVVADEPGFGWEFDFWAGYGNAPEFADPYAATTTFTMPDYSLNLFTNYTPAEEIPVEQVSMTLNGYYINANAGCLQLTTSEGTQFVQNAVTMLDYIVLADNAGVPDTTQVTGALRNSAKHWIGVKLEPEFGYTLEGLTAGRINAPFAEKILVTANTGYEAAVMLLVSYPPKALNKNNITVTNGTAYVNNTAVTNAVGGMIVRIEANEAPEGTCFAGWNVISSGVTPATREPQTTFVMGASAVQIEAVYQEPINYVEVQIQEPQAGMTPSYLARINPEADYMLDENSNIYCVNGVIWYDVDTEENLNPKTAVFEAGHTYGVQILLRAREGRRFVESNAVTGCVNGVTEGVCVDSYTQEPLAQRILTTSFFIPEDADVVAPVSQITLWDMDIPEVSMALDYTPEWNDMEYIAPCSLQDDEMTTRNGVTWTNITGQTPVVMRPEYAVAGKDQTYRVELLVSTTNFRVFRLDENGTPLVNATVNGQRCEVVTATGLEPTRYLKLRYYVQTKPLYNLEIENGLAFVENAYVSSGAYMAGTPVMLLPGAAPEGQMFSSWYITINGTTKEYYGENYQFEMPQSHVSVTPSYAPIHTHNTTPVEFKATTCQAPGWERHYLCEQCGRYSLDGTYTDIVDYATQIKIPKADHYIGGLEICEDGHVFVCGFGCGLTLTGIREHVYENGECPCGRKQDAIATILQGSKEIADIADFSALPASYVPETRYILLKADAQVDIALTGDLYIDLNGFAMSGTITTNGYKVYGMDATTNAYTCDRIGSFRCVDETGADIVPVREFKSGITGQILRYMAIPGDNGYSFHRFYLGVTHISIQPRTEGIGYKALFCGDEMVAGELASYGYRLWFDGYRNYDAEKGGQDFVSGKYVSLRITDYDVENFAEEPLHALATMTLKDGTEICSAEYCTTLRDMMERVSDQAGALDKDQRQALAEFIERHPIMKNWNTGNLYG